MGKRIRGRVLIGALCLALAAAVAFVLLPRMFASQSATERVIRAVQDVPAGTLITKEMITESEVGGYGLPSDVVRDAADAVGKVAAEPLYGGEYLSGRRLVTEAEYAASRAALTKLGAGVNLVTIEVPSGSAGVAGVLRAGDLADVYEYRVTENEEGEKEAAAALRMRGLYVQDVLNRNMQSLSELDRLKEQLPEGDTTNFDFAPVYVVFRCAQPEILTLIELEREDALHLALAKAVG